jgi:release factor glutamine methyltransferase
LVKDVLIHEYASKHPELVVCNPPYIQLSEKTEMDMNVLDFEPSNALFVYDSDALLFYKRIIGLFSFDNMPIIYFELNPLTADELDMWCQEKGLKCIVKTDLSGKKRFARISK